MLIMEESCACDDDDDGRISISLWRILPSDSDCILFDMKISSSRVALLMSMLMPATEIFFSASRSPSPASGDTDLSFFE